MRGCSASNDSNDSAGAILSFQAVPAASSSHISSRLPVCQPAGRRTVLEPMFRHARGILMQSCCSFILHSRALGVHACSQRSSGHLASTAQRMVGRSDCRRRPSFKRHTSGQCTCHVPMLEATRLVCTSTGRARVIREARSGQVVVHARSTNRQHLPPCVDIDDNKTLSRSRRC
jgi:hypothetical protein